MNGAQWLVRLLQRWGMEHIFVLHGNGLFPFLDAFIDSDIQVVDVRNEQAGAYMADAWGAMTGRPGVVAVSAGPGHTNALTGLTNAWWDGRPMLLISGCSPQETEGADTFQELDQVAMVKPVCKYAAKVHRIEALPQMAYTALTMAVSGRPGPVHLTIPHDVLSAEVDESQLRPQPIGPLQARPQATGDPALVQQAVDLLAGAAKPMMLIGSGAFYARAWDALRAFACATDIPILSHIWDRGCIEQAIPQYVGVTRSGQFINSALPKLAEAEVVLVVGARIDYRVGRGHPPIFPKNARVIHVDIEPSEIGRNLVPEVGIVGDPRSVLGQMTEEVLRRGISSHRDWLAEVRAARQLLFDKWDGLGHENAWPISSIRICREIKRFLDEEITFLIDGGNIGQWAHMALFDRHPSHWLTCGASGAVGWGLSGAIAAKLARPGHGLLLLSGDGSAGFNLSEISTALRFGTPYVTVVAHDGAWGIVADGQPDGRRIASQFGEIRFDRVAQALGARGVYIEQADQLGPAITEGLQANTVTVIHVPTQWASLESWEERFGSGGAA
jgi:acetolactate synthase-1/2/3 large subunit